MNPPPIEFKVCASGNKMHKSATDVLLVSSDQALIAQVHASNLHGGSLRVSAALEPNSDLTAAEVWLDLDAVTPACRAALPGLNLLRRVYFHNRNALTAPDLPPGVFVRKPCTLDALHVLWSNIAAPQKSSIADVDLRRLDGNIVDRKHVSPAEKHPNAGVLPVWALDLQELNLHRLARRAVELFSHHWGFRDVALYTCDARSRTLRLRAATCEDAFDASLEIDDCRGHANSVAGTQEFRAALRLNGRLLGFLHLSGRGTSAPLPDEAELPLAFLARAITNAQRFARARRQARIDSLTGLHNMRGIRETLQRELHRAQRLQNVVCILLLDLDGLKRINDVHGHAVGDRVLTQAAERITSALRQMDCAARRGGDEFLAVLPGTTLAGAQRVAQRILETLRHEPVRAGGKVHPLSASIGLAQNTAGGNVDQLFEAADRAMYAAKRAGGGRIVCHSPELDSAAQDAPSQTNILTRFIALAPAATT
jgi:diguanylate cyclase (GGDEF)-like protein